MENIIPIPVKMNLENSVPHEELLRSLCGVGVFVVGGFPLWLVGGASYYSDLDLCVLGWKAYYSAHKMLMEASDKWYKTPNSICFYVGDDIFQLLQPSTVQDSMLDLICSVDMSPSAIVLTLNESAFEVYALHPEDIESRLCRMLIRHDWTWYRVQTYKGKGYEIIEDVWSDETRALTAIQS